MRHAVRSSTFLNLWHVYALSLFSLCEWPRLRHQGVSLKDHKHMTEACGFTVRHKKLHIHLYIYSFHICWCCDLQVKGRATLLQWHLGIMLGHMSCSFIKVPSKNNYLNVRQRVYFELAQWLFKKLYLSYFKKREIKILRWHFRLLVEASAV